jgi:hypothetical protein
MAADPLPINEGLRGGSYTMLGFECVGFFAPRQAMILYLIPARGEQMLGLRP